MPVQQGEGVLTVQPPSFRFDLRLEEDRSRSVLLLNNLPTTLPLAPITPKLRLESHRSSLPCAANWPPWATRKPSTSALSKSTGRRSWLRTTPIKLLNPIASQLSVMRSSLLGSLLQVLKFNLDRKAARVRACLNWAVYSCVMPA